MYNGTMKRILITFVLIFCAVFAFSQDMSLFTSEYMRADGTFNERLILLETIRDMQPSGIGEFYHNALKFLIQRSPDIRTTSERADAEKSAVILCQGLGAEKYTDAAAEIWQTVELFDVVSTSATDGNAMQTALIALGQVDAQAYVPHIVQRLNNFNLQPSTDPESRRRIQMAVIGCISALETLHDIRGYRPVFFASVGTYESPIRQVAANALPNIVEDPCDVLIEVIRDNSNTPAVKMVAWNEMLKTRAPESSKARVAAAALEIGWTYITSNQSFVKNLSDMRKGAIDVIRQYGVANDSVYTYLEFSYSRNFINNVPDYDEIRMTLITLYTVKSDEAVNLLYKFLNELHARRRSGPWANKERQLFEWVTQSMGRTGTQSANVKNLLTLIGINNDYTSAERNMARDALISLNARQ